MKISVVFEGPPDKRVLVAVVDEHGNPVDVGTWDDIGNGMTALRLTLKRYTKATDVQPSRQTLELRQQLLRFINEDDGQLTAEQLTEKIGRSRSSTFAHLEVLRKEGCIFTLAGKYQLTPLGLERLG